jgi:hypothetical protein
MSSALCSSSSAHLHPDQERPAERTPVRWSTHPMVCAPRGSAMSPLCTGAPHAAGIESSAESPHAHTPRASRCPVGESRCCSAQPSASGTKGRRRKEKQGERTVHAGSSRAHPTLPTPSFAAPLRLHSQASSARGLSRAALSIAPPGRRGRRGATTATGTGERASEAARTELVMMGSMSRCWRIKLW